MMMSRIYKQASTVFAWLGGADRLSQDAIINLRHIAELSPDATTLDRMKISNVEEKETYELLGLPVIDRTSWIGIYMLLNRAWFKRAWVIQEASFAQDLVFLCGGVQFNFSALFRSVLMLYQTGWFHHIVNIADPLIQTYRDDLLLLSLRSQALSRIRLYRSRNSNIRHMNFEWHLLLGRSSLGNIVLDMPSFPSSPIPLVMLLRQHRFAEASNPRDKVYALWGMSKEALTQTRKLVDESVSFRVDYSLPPEKVFIQTAHFLIHSSKNLAILSLKESDANMNLPSWVPDLSVQSSAGEADQSGCFSASSSLGVASPVFLDHDKIQLSGVRVATVGKRI